MGVLEKKIELVLKTIYKKGFIRYQANARFPSLCLPSGNAIFGNGRRRKKKNFKGIPSRNLIPQQEY